MTEEHPDRPGQVALDDAIGETIKRIFGEWDLTAYDVVGVLHTIAARYAHTSISHDEDQ